jgi:glycosyltransferase involved in cell wall biosynthesis
MVRDLVREGWECHVVIPAPSPLQAEFEAAGATLHVVPMRRITRSGSGVYWLGYALRWPISEMRLLALARRLDPAVMHSNSLHCWFGWAVARVLRRTHVWHAREIVVQSSAALRLERWMCRHFAWRVVAVSRPVGAQLDGADVVVIHDVPDADEFSPSRAGQFRARVGLDDEVRLVGAAGRLDTWKGFDVMLDAVGALRTARPDVEVLIAGGPVPGKEGYAERLCRRAASMDGVHWLGERSDMPDLLADLDAFVVASTEPEPFATVMAEALASGVPVAATDHGGSPEMLAELPPSAGVLMPPGDPSALAAALIRLVPSGPSSAASRSQRMPMRLQQTTTFAELFDQARLSGAQRERAPATSS